MTSFKNSGTKLSTVLKASSGSEYYSKKILLAILSIGLLGRIFISFFTALPHYHTDSQDYFLQADTILRGGYTNFFPNGYPFIVALAKTGFGNAAIPVLLWLNIFMSVAGIYFTYDIAKKLFGQEKIALLAAFIVTFFPSQINYVRWLMTEVPTSFFLLGSYFFYYNKKNWLCGLFLGLATLVRTEVLLILILFVVLDAIFQKKANAGLLVGALVPLVMLGSYCYIKTGEFSLAGHGRFNILASVTANGDHIDWHYSDKHPEYDTNAKAVKLYFDTFKNAPLAFIKSRLANLWELWGFYASPTTTGRGVANRLVIGLGNLFLIVFGLPAWWRNRKNYNVLITIIPFFVVTVVHIVYFAMQRYTYPVEPFMIILASWSVLTYLKKPALKTA